jgi:hypothetical protein
VHSFTIAIGAIAFLCGLIALVVTHFPPGFVFLFWGGVLVAAVVFERFRYKPLALRAPQGNWVKTPERFIDDETGKPVTVYLDPQTGERSYVAD